MTDADLVSGLAFTLRVASNTISKATYDVQIEVVWVENGHVHYRKGNSSAVYQTAVERFLEIVNNQPRYWR